MIELFKYTDEAGKRRKIIATLHSSYDDMPKTDNCLLVRNIHELPAKLSIQHAINITRSESGKEKIEPETIIQYWLLAFHKFEIIEKIFQANKKGKQFVQIYCE